MTFRNDPEHPAGLNVTSPAQGVPPGWSRPCGGWGARSLSGTPSPPTRRTAQGLHDPEKAEVKDQRSKCKITYWIPAFLGQELELLSQFIKCSSVLGSCKILFLCLQFLFFLLGSTFPVYLNEEFPAKWNMRAKNKNLILRDMCSNFAWLFVK